MEYIIGNFELISPFLSFRQVLPCFLMSFSKMRDQAEYFRHYILSLMDQVLMPQFYEGSDFSEALKNQPNFCFAAKHLSPLWQASHLAKTDRSFPWHFGQFIFPFLRIFWQNIDREQIRVRKITVILGLFLCHA